MRKIPLQVYLDEALHQQLRLVAEREKIAQSELVRRYLREGIARDLDAQDPALEIIGLGEGSTPDLAARHDHYLAQHKRRANEAGRLIR
ncbi:MAG: CopG family transcriptional regulator [Clostridia bacterium]|nr:MAG: CopG family transcriptional regulator [Clostridia bacterium]